MKIIGVIQLDTATYPEFFLPSKALGGKKPFEYILKLLANVKGLDSVWVAMPDNSDNRQFVSLIEAAGIKAFFGSMNPAHRIFALGKTAGAEAVFRVPSNMAALDPATANGMMEKFISESADLCFDEISSLKCFYDLTRVDAIGAFISFENVSPQPGFSPRYYQWMMLSPMLMKIVSTCPNGKEELCAGKNRIPWYHNMDLGDGIWTRGPSDHADILHKRSLPEKMNGERVADVGSYDGLYAFEAERRGAREVYSFDIPDGTPHDTGKGIAKEALQYLNSAVRQRFEVKYPIDKNRGFEFAREVYRSKVVREYCNIYDLSAAKYGTFDRVFCFALLLHLLKPMLALEKLSEICSGTLHLHTFINNTHGDDPVMWFYEGYHDRGHKDYVTWWLPSVECLKQMLRTAGFRHVHVLGLHGTGAVKDQAEIMAVK